MKRIITLFSVIIFSAIFCTASKAQDKYDAHSGELYNEILHMDSLLFNAFNSRNLEQMEKYFDQGLELFQDNRGVRNYDEAMAGFGGIFKKDFVLTRKLVPGSLEVFILLRITAPFKQVCTRSRTWRTGKR